MDEGGRHGTSQPGVQDESCFAVGGAAVPGITSLGTAGVCATTTGRAGYCLFAGDCFPCKKDADCQQLCGPQAACIICDDCISTGGTSCVNPEASGCDIP
jgi:hypothetical protein